MRAASLKTSILSHHGLITLQAPSKLGRTGELPTRILMMKWGENDTAEGPMTVGLKTLQASTLWDSLGFGEVAIDFNHNTCPGHPSYQGEPAKIAAVCTPRVIEGEGLVFDNIRWTEEGRENREHYPDLSPAIKLDDDGEVIFCHSGALARNGAVKGLHLCAASDLSADLTRKITTLMAKAEKTPTHEVKTPSVHKPGTFMINTDLLKGILKLPADATDDDINNALTALDGSTADPASGGDAAAAAPEDAPNPTAVKALGATLIKAIKAIKDELGSEIKTLNARLDGAERQAIVEAATAAGKIVPPEWLPNDKGVGGLPNGQLRTLCATLPEIVPLSARTPRDVRDPNAGGSAISAVDREVMKNLGLTEEQWKKANQG
jgi:phage I-like protein